MKWKVVRNSRWMECDEAVSFVLNSEYEAGEARECTIPHLSFVLLFFVYCFPPTHLYISKEMGFVLRNRLAFLLLERSTFSDTEKKRNLRGELRRDLGSISF